MEGQHTVSIQHTSATMAGLLQQTAAQSPPTNSKSISWFLAYIVWTRTKPQCYWNTPKCNTCNSRDPRSPPTRGTLVSVAIYEKNLSTETSTIKIHQDMGCQQGIVLSEKSRTKWLTHVEAHDIENSSLVDNLRWTTNSYTTYAQCHPHGPVPG